jgi:hypothetical protein
VFHSLKRRFRGEETQGTETIWQWAIYVLPELGLQPSKTQIFITVIGELDRGEALPRCGYGAGCHYLDAQKGVESCTHGCLAPRVQRTPATCTRPQGATYSSHVQNVMNTLRARKLPTQSISKAARSIDEGQLHCIYRHNIHAT